MRSAAGWGPRPIAGGAGAAGLEQGMMLLAKPLDLPGEGLGPKSNELGTLRARAAKGEALVDRSPRNNAQSSHQIWCTRVSYVGLGKSSSQT